MSCNVQNVIYVIVCSGCKKEYIGETGDFLRKRVNVHRQHIRDPNVRILYVSEHIDNCAKQETPMFTIFPLLKNQTENTLLRREKESYFIKLFKPALNSRGRLIQSTNTCSKHPCLYFDVINVMNVIDVTDVSNAFSFLHNVYVPLMICSKQ